MYARRSGDNCCHKERASRLLASSCATWWRIFVENIFRLKLHHLVCAVLLETADPHQLISVDIVLPVVYTEAAGMAATSSAGWASEALLEGGVPVRECWEAVMGLHDQVGSSRVQQYSTADW